MRKYLLAALVASAVATPAMAQDSTDRAAFTGFKVEGIAGWDRPKVPGSHDNGIVYGVGTGYDFQAGHFVLGIEGEASDSSAKKCIAGGFVTGDRLCSDAGRDLYAGGRIGALVTPTTLLYAKAGYTNARVNSDYTSATGGPASFSLRQNLDGVRVGAGLEHALGRNAFVKAEYRYSNYEQGVERHQVVGGIGLRF
ncbi:MAG: opacity protein [Alphaproteobacteria bacterium]|nr:opacity protein [Alphaproteobacteria bacterium]